MSESNLAVKRYNFDSQIFDEFNSLHYAKDLWPLVYILSDDKSKEAYVGETTDAYSRMKSHLKHDKKQQLTVVHLITSEKFNKSATLDIESNLIKYISGDGKFKLINGNLGIANHEYYQKREVYWGVFKRVWNQLRAEGISNHSLEHIDNSDLYKYSPYKTLTGEQKIGLLLIINNLLSDKLKNVIIEGGAGTGKTILAIFLFKLLNSDNTDFNFKEFGAEENEFIVKVKELKAKFPNPNMALVIPMSSFRNTLKKVFRNIKGLKASMVVGPAQVAKNTYDIVLVDESHRLRRRVNLGAYFGAFDKACIKLDLDRYTASELDFVIKQSDKTVLFYDEGQSIKPSDVKKEDFDKLKQASDTNIEYLKSQFRVRGGNGYVKFIDGLLKCKLSFEKQLFKSDEYEFLLFDSLENMVSEIKLRDKEHGLSRLVAGYAWPWISNKDATKFDINIGDVSLKWNSVAVDWVNTEGSINEVGCIHTTQGYDLNYTGVIFGHEISYDKEKDEIVIKEENYFDKNGKQSIKDPEDLKEYILNIYKTIMLRGIRGTYVYVCDDDLRAYFAQHLDQFKSKVESIYLEVDKVVPFENSVPLYNLNAAAGNFSDNQIIDINEFDWVKIPNHVKASNNLFACKVYGESMNQIIPNGSVCLFRKYSGGSRDGKIVLVQHSNIQDSEFGAGYTVKEYHSTKQGKENGQWRHGSITLKPLSNDEGYEDIELAEVEMEGFKVVGVFECVL
ncbi:hypothetical protein DNU06_05910 [Putridiphycobacter roseus]|uniref:GIY-YIG domain-containing protein n=1 Tax=Putridiphycobacter roseus TaxID=2219161 RepID=A0A2W1N3K3_9FLAO|nr:DNA/RNA helicase domain-containing protein [Putridiphycobacter roseus]PZE18150.1 hypothetical protein DNU06_05910 [Putridiphycobacter roseus]